MRALFVVTILALAAGLGGCAGWSAERAVARHNQALHDGIRARDEARLREVVAPDFRWNAPAGMVVGRDGWIEHLKAVPGEIESVTMIRPHTQYENGTLTVCGKQRAVLRVEGKEQIDDNAFCDDWQRREGRWQLVRSYQPTIEL
jgi:hypothetical protein